MSDRSIADVESAAMYVWASKLISTPVADLVVDPTVSRFGSKAIEHAYEQSTQQGVVDVLAQSLVSKQQMIVTAPASPESPGQKGPAAPTPSKEVKEAKVVQDGYPACRTKDGLNVLNRATIVLRSSVQDALAMLDTTPDLTWKIRTAVAEYVSSQHVTFTVPKDEERGKFMDLFPPQKKRDAFGVWTLRVHGATEQFLLYLGEYSLWPSKFTLDHDTELTIRLDAFMPPVPRPAWSTKAPLAAPKGPHQPPSPEETGITWEAKHDPLGTLLKALPAADLKCCELGEFNKTRLFIDYFNTTKEKRKAGRLVPKVVEAAFTALHKKYHGIEGRLREELRLFFFGFTLDMDPARGMCLWGPPGTGKTTYLQHLVQRCGFNLVCPVLGGMDVADSYHGGTETNLRELFSRPANVPWLPACLIIDEVEGLVPNRRELKGDSTSAGVVTTFINSFGGGQDTPNLNLAVATNYLQKIDEAVARRLVFKIFVGLPSPDARDQFLLEAKCLQIDPAALEAAKTWTTNFSSANMKNLVHQLEQTTRMELIKHPDNKELVSPEGKFRITKTEMLEATRSVARRDGVLVGPVYFPELLSTGIEYLESRELQMLREYLVGRKETRKHGEQVTRATGCVLVNNVANREKDESKNRGKFQVETVAVSATENKAKPVATRSVVAIEGCRGLRDMSRSEVLTRTLTTLAVFCNASNIFTFRVLTNEVFLRKNITEESAMLNYLEEIATELDQYNSSMLVIDMDSIAVMEPSDTDTKSIRLSNERIVKTILAVASLRCKVDAQYARFVVLMASDEGLVARCKKVLNWLKDEEEVVQEEEEEAQRICCKCFAFFKRKDNKEDNCRYHNGLVRNEVTSRPDAPDTEQARTLILDCLGTKELTHTRCPDDLVWTCGCNEKFKFVPGDGVASGHFAGKHAEDPRFTAAVAALGLFDDVGSLRATHRSGWDRKDDIHRDNSGFGSALSASQRTAGSSKKGNQPSYTASASPKAASSRPSGESSTPKKAPTASAPQPTAGAPASKSAGVPRHGPGAPASGTPKLSTPPATRPALPPVQSRPSGTPKREVRIPCGKNGCVKQEIHFHCFLGCTAADFSTEEARRVHTMQEHATHQHDLLSDLL